MKIINKAVPWLASLSVFFSFEQLFANPKFIYWLVPIAIFVNVVGVWQLTTRSLTSEKFWRFAVTPFFFLSTGVLFFSFFEGDIIRRLLLVAFSVLIWIYFEVIRLWFHERPKYQVHSLENISTYLDLLTIFFAASGFYSLILFFGWNLWYFSLGFTAITALVTYQLIWTSGASLRSAWAYLITITVVVSELFVVTSYLPSSVYVNGLIVTLGFYLTAGLARNWLIDVKEKSILKRYLAISIFSLIIILITAKWY